MSFAKDLKGRGFSRAKRKCIEPVNYVIPRTVKRARDCTSARVGPRDLVLR